MALRSLRPLAVVVLALPLSISSAQIAGATVLTPTAVGAAAIPSCAQALKIDSKTVRVHNGCPYTVKMNARFNNYPDTGCIEYVPTQTLTWTSRWGSYVDTVSC